MQRRGKITGIHWTIVIKEEMTTGLGVRLGPETHSRWWSVNNVKRNKSLLFSLIETWESSIMGVY